MGFGMPLIPSVKIAEMKTNVYHRADTATLLKLKQQESDAILDILQSINTDFRPEQIVRVAGYSLRAQLGIGKMCLCIYEKGALKPILGFGTPTPTALQLQEVSKITLLTATNTLTLPWLQENGFEYLIPFTGKQGLEGLLMVGDFAHSFPEQQNDLIFMQTVVKILGIALENKRLFDEKVTQEALKRELTLAEEIQQRLLPRRFDIFLNVEASALNMPNLQVGGDFYDIVKVKENCFYVCMADVAGKSISAALVMAVMQASLKALVRNELPLEDIILSLHETLFAINQGEKFVTLFLGKIELEKQTITYINAGHNPPLLVNANQHQELMAGCIPLGIMALSGVEVGTATLSPGSVLFLYTDGLTEQLNPSEEQFGALRVLEVLQSHQSLPIESVIAHMRQTQLEFAQGIPSGDDISMMAIRF
ncbi:MAG: serine/threonine-protein phosphatase [Sphingobacteriia bacterium]|nr:serine/threonine-protein phosphatase [Sphingobacteriia bacterium]